MKKGVLRTSSAVSPTTFLTEGSGGAYANLLLWVRSKKLLREAPVMRDVGSRHRVDLSHQDLRNYKSHPIPLTL